MSGCALGGLGGAEDKDNELVCPVCFELISEAYVTRCGHSFCFSCVAKALDLQRRCPKCGASLPSREHIFPNFLLNELVAKKRARMAASAAAGAVPGSNTLRALVAAEASTLPLPDVDCMLQVLSRRKQLLQADSEVCQQRLLRQFLSTLLRDRETRVQALAREAQLVRKDLDHVDAVLAEVRGSTAALGGSELTESIDSMLASVEDAPADTPGGTGGTGGGDERFAGGGSADTLAARWRRLTQHFDDFVQCYLGHRADELYFPAASPAPIGDIPAPAGTGGAPSEVPSVAGAAGAAGVAGGAPGGPREVPTATDDAAHAPLSRAQSAAGEVHIDGLESFRSDLAAFTRFRALRPLATLAYCSDAINYSTIVSTIEFDKDDQLFAIAGVTKRIKVFDYGAVVRDAVDVHYPHAEMACAHKVSSVSWNAYHRHVLASADYEGGVALWDVAAATRTRALHEHDKRVWSVHFSRADVRLLASGSDDARVKLWALNAERSVATLDARFNVCCVRFNPKSAAHLAFGCADHCVHYYDLRSPRAPLAVLRDHRKAVSYVKFVDSRTIVSASTDSQLKLWSVDSPRCLRSFTGHANEKNFVGLATDGKYIACGSENNALYVYYKGLSKPLLSYKFEAVRGFLERERRDDEPSEFVSAVCWRRAQDDSHVLLAANSQGTIKVLQLI